MEHPGQHVKFKFKVERTFHSALTRQIAEAVRIRRVGEDKILNSKGVYNRCRLPRLMMEEFSNEKVKAGPDPSSAHQAHPMDLQLKVKNKNKRTQVVRTRPAKRPKLKGKEAPTPRLEGVVKRKHDTMPGTLKRNARGFTRSLNQRQSLTATFPVSQLAQLRATLGHPFYFSQYSVKVTASSTMKLCSGSHQITNQKFKVWQLIQAKERQAKTNQ